MYVIKALLGKTSTPRSSSQHMWSAVLYACIVWPLASNLKRKNTVYAVIFLLCVGILQTYAVTRTELGENYYSMLDVSLNASKRDIRRAWRSVSLQHHPDKVGSNHTSVFNSYRHAYETLYDEEKRSLYDRFGPTCTGKEFECVLICKISLAVWVLSWIGMVSLFQMRRKHGSARVWSYLTVVAISLFCWTSSIEDLYRSDFLPAFEAVYILKQFYPTLMYCYTIVSERLYEDELQVRLDFLIKLVLKKQEIGSGRRPGTRRR